MAPRLYFEPLDDQSVLNILENEAGSALGRERPEHGADGPEGPLGPTASAPAIHGRASDSSVNSVSSVLTSALPPVVTQFGGQTAIGLPAPLAAPGAPLPRTSRE